MSIRGSNGEFHATLLLMLAEMKRDGKRMDLRIVALERRADQMERRADQMERRMETAERQMKKVDERLNRTARILAGAAEALKFLDRRVTTLESQRS